MRSSHESFSVVVRGAHNTLTTLQYPRPGMGARSKNLPAKNKTKKLRVHINADVADMWSKSDLKTHFKHVV